MIRAVDSAGRPSSPEETRARILAATREIFARNGTRGTTTREVAEAAGVNEATIFRHFGSKTAMIDAMRERYCDIAHFDVVLASLSGDLRADLRAIGGLLFAAMVRNRDLICISLAEAQLDPKSAESAWRGPTSIREALRDFMAARVAEGTLVGDADRHARAFMSLIFAYVVGRRLWEHDEPDPAMIEYFTAVFLDGARRRNEE